MSTGPRVLAKTDEDDARADWLVELRAAIGKVMVMMVMKMKM